MGSLRYAVAVLAAVLALTGCSSSGPEPDQTDAGGDDETEATEAGGETPDDDSPSPQTTRVPALVPTTAEDLEISVDADGRPYEVGYDPDRSTVDPRFATVLETGDEVVLIDGDGIYGDPEPALSVADDLRLPGTEELRLTVLWAVPPDDDSGGDDEGDGDGDELIGVRLDRPGSTVVEWREREQAFVGLSGIGVITVEPAVEGAIESFKAEEPAPLDPPTDDEPLLIADLDDRPGRETVVLDLAAAPSATRPAFGRGGPRHLVSVGFDEDGVAASIVIAADSLPWRIVVPDGTPPPDVTEREDQLIACIEGRRLVDKWGHCI